MLFWYNDDKQKNFLICSGQFMIYLPIVLLYHFRTKIGLSNYLLQLLEKATTTINIVLAHTSKFDKKCNLLATIRTAQLRLINSKRKRLKN